MEPAELLARGGVWYNIAGGSPEEALADAVAALAEDRRLPKGLDPAAFLAGLSERERTASTAVGGRLAFPHPKSPAAPEPSDAFIALFYPRFPVPWNAPDGEAVRAFFIVLSHNANGHLLALSRLAKACAAGGFRALLDAEAGEAELVAYLAAGSLPSPTR